MALKNLPVGKFVLNKISFQYFLTWEGGGGGIEYGPKDSDDQYWTHTLGLSINNTKRNEEMQESNGSVYACYVHIDAIATVNYNSILKLRGNSRYEKYPCLGKLS